MCDAVGVGVEDLVAIPVLGVVEEVLEGGGDGEVLAGLVGGAVGRFEANEGTIGVIPYRW